MAVETYLLSDLWVNRFMGTLEDVLGFNLLVMWSGLEWRRYTDPGIEISNEDEWHTGDLAVYGTFTETEGDLVPLVEAYRDQLTDQFKSYIPRTDSIVEGPGNLLEAHYSQDGLHHLYVAVNAKFSYPPPQYLSIGRI